MAQPSTVMMQPVGQIHNAIPVGTTFRKYHSAVIVEHDGHPLILTSLKGD